MEKRIELKQAQTNLITNINNQIQQLEVRRNELISCIISSNDIENVISVEIKDNKLILETKE